MRITKEMVQKQNKEDKKKLLEIINKQSLWFGRTCQAGSSIADDICTAYNLLKDLLSLEGISKDEYDDLMGKICSVRMIPFRNPRAIYKDYNKEIEPQEYYELPFAGTREFYLIP